MRILSILIVIALSAWASLAQAEQRQIIVTNQIDGHTQLAASDIDDDAVEEAVEDTIEDTRKAVDKAQKAMIDAARARGFSPADDNEADAIAILFWALETKGGMQ